MRTRNLVLVALLVALAGGAGVGERGSREEGGLHGEAVEIGEWMLGQGMDLYYSGKDPHACAKMLRGAVRVGAGRRAADPALAPRASHLVLQARLFLANLLAQSRTPTGMRLAEELYLNALRAASPGANTLASVSKENLGASRRHVPGARASSERFLVFRFWAGLSNRRQELIGVMAAAKLLGRTLVLPDIVEGRWMASHGSDRPKLPVSAIYEEGAMKGFVPVLTEQEFQAQAPSLPPLSAELFVRDFAYTGQLTHLGLWYGRVSVVPPSAVQQPLTPEELIDALGNSPAQGEIGGRPKEYVWRVVAVDFSYRLIDLGVAGEFEFFNGTSEWTPVEVSPKFSPSPIYHQVLNALSFGGRAKAAGEAWMARHNLALAHADTSGPARRARQCTSGSRPEPAAHDAQEQRNAPCTSGRERFMAVHLRRGDMDNWRNRQHAWPEKEAVASQTVANMQRLGISRVFLATDTTQEEKKWLKGAIPGLLTFEVSEGEPLHEAEIAIVDQVIAGHSTFFLGNFWSTFSWAIIEERYKHGAQEESNAFQQAPFSPAVLARVGPVRNLR